MMRLLSLAGGLIAATLACNGMAQTKADNDPFKYSTYTGRMVCQDQVIVSVLEDKNRPHHFDIVMGKSHYKTRRVPTESGAIRLEDKTHGIVWLQMSNKSMLFNEKVGKRLANDCRSAIQTANDRELRETNAPNILDSLTRNAPNAVVTP